MKKILIIGGNGYIGTKMKNTFKNDYIVNSVDLCWFNNSDDDTLVTDYNTLDKEYYEQFDVIILLAGHSSVKMCEGDIKFAYKNNITNFLNLLSKINKKQKFIYASSSSVYGDTGVYSVDESYNTFKPHNHYDLTKYIIDLYINKFDIEYYSLRFGTVNGFSLNTRKDIMINSMVYNALSDGEIKLYIKDIMRPILGINDLINGVKQIIDCTEDKRGVYNMASFNKTAEEIAYGVSSILNIPVVEYDSEPKIITNSKLQTKTYNFSIITNKFSDTFNYVFKDSIETITKSLVENFDKINFTDRSNIQKYGE